MALGIGNLFTSGNVTQTGQTSQPTGTTSVVVVPKGTEGALDLSVGNTVAGQIKDIQGDQITLNLGNQNEMTAKMDTAGANLQVGQTVVFEVLSNQNNKLALSPLYTNLQANISTAQNALKAAGMPATSDNLAMVTQMLKEGLSVDKQSLWNMSRLSTEFKAFQPSSVVELTAMGLEVNKGNLGQLEAYHNMTHQLMDSFGHITGGMEELVRSFGGQGQFEEGLQFMKDMLQAVSGGNTGIPAEGTGTGQATVTGETPEQIHGGQPQNPESATGSTENIPQNGQRMEETLPSLSAAGHNGMADPVKELTVQNRPGAEEQIRQASGEMIEEKAMEAAKASDGTPQTEGRDPSLTAENTRTGNAKTEVQGALLRGELALAQALSSKDPGKLIQYLKNADPEIVLRQMQQGTLTEKDVTSAFASLKQLMASGKEDAAKAFADAGDAFRKVFHAKMQNEWLLKPENFADKEKVQEFYHKLTSGSEKMAEILANSGKTESVAGQALQNIHQNLDFMQALNQAFPYIQIPLRTGLQNAHGDLYVYANRHKKISEDGSVSALLHLDMDHLGNLDVYLKLMDQKVQTHFYVEDEDTIDFLAANIHLLDERLAEKGYSVNSAVTGRPKPGDVAATEDVISRIRGEGSEDKMISMSSFDAKA